MIEVSADEEYAVNSCHEAAKKTGKYDHVTDETLREACADCVRHYLGEGHPPAQAALMAGEVLETHEYLFRA